MLENVHQHNIMFSYVRMEDEGWRWRWRGMFAVRKDIECERYEYFHEIIP